MTKLKFTTTMLFLALTQSALADLNTTGVYIPSKNSVNNVQEQINHNIVETEQNIAACELHLKEIKKIHKQIQYKLENFEESIVKRRLKLIRKDLKKYELELEKEIDETKKQELREIINAVKAVSQEIKKDER